MSDKNAVLVINLDGGVQETNFSEFNRAWLAKIDGAVLTPETDQEFSAAEQFIKDCTASEKEIKSILDAAIKGNADVSRLLDGVNGLLGTIRTTRLTATKAVKEKKESIKAGMVKAGEQRIVEFIKGMYGVYPGIYDCLSPDLSPIKLSVKGKRTVDSLNAAVNAAVEKIEEETGVLADECNENLKLVEASELQVLFPDKKDLIKKPTGEVVALIEGREAQHRLEVERRENAAKIRNPEALSKLKSEVDEKGHFIHLENWARKHAQEISDELPNKEDLAEFRAYYSEKLRQLKGDPPPATDERPRQESPNSSPSPMEQVTEAGRYTIHLSADIDGTKAQAGELRDAFHTLVSERPFVVGDIKARLAERTDLLDTRKFKDFIRKANELNIMQDMFDISEMEFPPVILDVIGDFLILKSEILIDKRRWYETSVTVLETPVGIVGIRHISGMYSEQTCVEDICFDLSFHAVSEINDLTYIIKDGNEKV